MKQLGFLFMFFALSCCTSVKQTSNFAHFITWEASFIECPKENYNGKLTVTFTNRTDKRWYVSPKAIVFPIYTKENTAASKYQISHRTSSADSLTYKLEPFRTITFNLEALNFNDYKLRKGEEYYTVGSYGILFGERFINGYRRIDQKIETVKIPFKVCD
jgi:hypothetical protein